MPVIDGGQPSSPGEPTVRVEPSLAVELEWVMDSAMHRDWQAEHPDLDDIYRRHPGLTADLKGLWGPDRATSCGGFLELTVLAELAGQLFTTDAGRLFDALPEAMAHAPSEAARLPLHSETEEDRAAVWSRLAALRRSKARRARYLEVARHSWEVAAGAWSERGRASVERAVAAQRRQLQAGVHWTELGGVSHCFSTRLPEVVAEVGPGAEVALVPSYFAHKGLWVDVKKLVMVSVRSEPLPSDSRARTTGLARQLKTISDPTRLAILDRLRRSPASVTELAGSLALAQPTVSNHVKLLRDAGLLVDVRQGRSRRLTVRSETLDQLLGELQDLLALPHGPGGAAPAS